MKAIIKIFKSSGESKIECLTMDEIGLVTSQCEDAETDFSIEYQSIN